MAFGLSFGSKKQSSSTNSTIDKDTTTNVDQTQATTGSTTTTGNTSSTGSTSQTGNTTNNQSQTSGTTGSQTQTGVTTTLDSAVSDALSGKVQELLSGIDTGGISSAANSRLGSFNANQYVTDTITAARQAGEAQLQEQQSLYNSAIGGTAGTNSMAALLAQRGRNDLETSLAGIRANAVSTAEGIQNSNLAAAAGATGGVADIVANLGNVLKGATTTSDVSTLTQELSKLLGQNTGTTAQTGTSTEQTSSQQTQLLQQIVDLLGTTNESTHATEVSKTKGKSSGGGLSLSI